jgi:hypothetical protein
LGSERERKLKEKRDPRVNLGRKSPATGDRVMEMVEDQVQGPKCQVKVRSSEKRELGTETQKVIVKDKEI